MTTLDEVIRVVNIGNTIEIEVTGSGTRNDCVVTLPSGIRLDMSSYTATKSTVKFLETQNAVCRVRIGPISEDMLGSWLIAGKFRTHQGIFNNFRRPIKIIKEGILFFLCFYLF